MPKKRGVQVPKKQAFFVYFSHEINFQTYERGQEYEIFPKKFSRGGAYRNVAGGF